MATDLGDARKATTWATSRASMKRRTEVGGCHLLLGLLGRDALGASPRFDHPLAALRPGGAWVDHGDVDPVRAELVRHVLGHRAHGHVAHASDRRPGLTGGEAADVDDAPPSLPPHVRGDLPGAAQVAHHLDVHVGPEVVVGDLGQRRHGAAAEGLGRAVDQYVDPSQLPGGAVDHGLHRFVGLRCPRRSGRTVVRSRRRAQLLWRPAPRGPARRSQRRRPRTRCSRAIALPIPRLPPVTIAVFPVSSRSTSVLHGAAKRRAQAGSESLSRPRTSRG